MPTRKQRRREAKSKRHEYEFVYVDAEGHELEDPPDELEPERERASKNGKRANGDRKAKRQPQRRDSRGRPVRTPPVPSWKRASRRALILGAVVLVLFSTTSKGNYAQAALLAVTYTVLFIPFTYWLDRTMYRRWEAKQSGAAPARPARKR